MDRGVELDCVLVTNTNSYALAAFFGPIAMIAVS
jgi:hypothetical protein